MRISRAMLSARVDRLNAVLNRPAAGWTRLAEVTGGRVTMRANIGHFVLESYSPGDGWTRYTLSMLVNDGGGQMNVSPCCTLQEMWVYLRGVFDVLDSVHMCDGDKHTFDTYKSTPVSLGPTTKVGR
jgi:hypothetical protein